MSLKVTVLTAIMISHKAWNNATTQTIRNCFRKYGFVKTIDNEEEVLPITLEVDTQHNTLWTVLDNQLTFEDYVAIDDDLAVCGSVTDDEIFASFNNEEVSSPPSFQLLQLSHESDDRKCENSILKEDDSSVLAVLYFP
ncbi:hypothetical protein ACI65C_008438 [Semiaphis heraclei]